MNTLIFIYKAVVSIEKGYKASHQQGWDILHASLKREI